MFSREAILPSSFLSPFSIGVTPIEKGNKNVVAELLTLKVYLFTLNTVIKRLGKISSIFVSVSVVGNLGRVDYITEYEYDLFIRPDTCNPRFRVWFNFTVENVKADQVGDETCPCITYRRCRFGLS